MTSYLRNMIDHPQAHIDRGGGMTVVSFISFCGVQTRNTVIAVTENFYSLAVVSLWKYADF